MPGVYSSRYIFEKRSVYHIAQHYWPQIRPLDLFYKAAEKAYQVLFRKDILKIIIIRKSAAMPVTIKAQTLVILDDASIA